MSNPASIPQLSFIEKLITPRVKTLCIESVEAAMNVLREERLTKQGASELITSLKSMPTDPIERPAPVAGAAAALAVEGRRNSYAGKCKLCGKTVAAGAGLLTGSRGAWTTEHLPGECPVQVEETVVELTEEEIISGKLTNASAWAFVKAVVQKMEKGGYAVPAVSGDNDLTFFYIKENQGRFDPSKKGEKRFNHVVGGGQEFPVTPSFVLRCLAAAEAVGMIEAQTLYAREYCECARCGKDLTDYVSRGSGFGPDCRGKLGIVVTAAQRAAWKIEFPELVPESEKEMTEAEYRHSTFSGTTESQYIRHMHRAEND